jgi:AcrR family transcriptional regulator
VEAAAELTGNSRGRRSRERLLEAARVCFGRHGYAATRIADITAEAAMSQGGFYRHFKDKNDILVAALREPLDALLDATGPLSQLSGDALVDEAAIIAAHTGFFRVYADHREVLRVIREAAAMHEPGLRELWLEVRGRYTARIEAWLRRLQAAGLLDTSDLVLLSEVLGATLDQTAYTRLGLADGPPAPAEVDALGRVTGELWARALRP